MNDEVRLLLAHAIGQLRDQRVRESLSRCTTPGADIADLYGASSLIVDLVSKGRADASLGSAVAKAINLALARGERSSHIGALVVRRAAAPSALVATRGRPAPLAAPRAIFDGSEPDTTLALPKAGAVSEATEEAVAGFFAPKPEVPVRPEMARELVEVAGDTAARSRRELHSEVVGACMENIAMLARHRDERPFGERSDNEEALLRFIDAVAASGGQCVRVIAQWWRGEEDPWKTWAAVLTLGCFPESDTLSTILTGLEQLPADAADHAMTAAEALLVAPHPHVLQLAIDLSESPNPIARAVGVEVLGRKGALAPDQVRHHARDANTPVLAAALGAARVLGAEWAPPFLTPFLDHPARPVAWRAAEQLARLQQNTAYYHLRQGGCSGLGAKALEVFIQFGDASDLERVDEVVAREKVTTELLSAVGRLGDPRSWAFLLHHLADPELADAAIGALVTIFGPLVAAREARRAETWREAIEKLPIERGMRMRSGKPWHPSAVVAECLQGSVPRATVQARIDELAARVGAAIDVDLALWSPDVRAPLDAALSAAGKRPFRAGSWDCHAAGFRA